MVYFYGNGMKIMCKSYWVNLKIINLSIYFIDIKYRLYKTIKKFYVIFSISKLAKT
jgi:hypothetical protein